ncbi:Rv3235 family protein [Nocardioides sp. W7]|uniref:Rv3235 family protein n=1 Tax=Nocardioides sp. W7 TaxID=2931390 RepID=UPI001FD0C3E8|nr:Rv3235 family protein [Nocardioides sp. W7]
MNQSRPDNVVRLRVPVPVASVQGTLALDLQPRHDPPRAVPPQDRGSGDDATPVDVRRRREVERWAHRFAQAAVEIVGGDRPATQLLRWTTGEVYTDLHRRALLVARAGGHQPGAARVQPVRPQVLSVRTCFVEHGAVEAGVHVRYGDRSRAVAARFELKRSRHESTPRWICTALEFA